MDQLPSSSLSLKGLLRSSHALVGLLAVCAIGAFGISLGAGFRFGEYLFSSVFVVLLLCVLFRYSAKGPEADRSLPSISVTHQDNRMQAQIVNIEATHEIITVLQAVANRRPLPLPSAIIEGSASDPSAYRPITPEVAKELWNKDSQLLMPSAISSPPVSSSVKDPASG
jgi:hypothetical protein